MLILHIANFPTLVCVIMWFVFNAAYFAVNFSYTLQILFIIIYFFSLSDGYNVCIFAYGQTGSGKTFTMEGSPANKGVSPRAIQELLNQVEGLKETSTYTVTLSMLEIYNETILDLLPLGGVGKDREKLEIRQTGDGGNQVVGLTETIVSCVSNFLHTCIFICSYLYIWFVPVLVAITTTFLKVSYLDDFCFFFLVNRLRRWRRWRS